MLTESVRIGCSFQACCSRSAKYQRCLIFHRPSPTLYPDLGYPPRYRPVMGLYSLSGKTSQPVVVKCIDTISRHHHRPYTQSFKGNRLVVNLTDLTWSFPVKTESLQAFNFRVSNISAGQAVYTSQPAINRNRKAVTATDKQGSV